MFELPVNDYLHNEVKKKNNRKVHNDIDSQIQS